MGDLVVVTEGVFAAFDAGDGLWKAGVYLEHVAGKEHPGSAIEFFASAECADLGEADALVVHAGQGADHACVTHGDKTVGLVRRVVDGDETVLMHADLGDPVEVAVGEHLAVDGAVAPYGEHSARHGGDAGKLSQQWRRLFAEDFDETLFAAVHVEIGNRQHALNVFHGDVHAHAARSGGHAADLGKETVGRVNREALPHPIEQAQGEFLREAHAGEQTNGSHDVPTNPLAHQCAVLAPDLFGRPREMQHGQLAQRRTVQFEKSPTCGSHDLTTIRPVPDNAHVALPISSFNDDAV